MPYKDKAAAKAWRDANKERLKEYSRAYFAEHGAEVNVRRAEAKKEWAAKNKDSVKESRRKHYEVNRETINAAKRDAYAKDSTKKVEYRRLTRSTALEYGKVYREQNRPAIQKVIRGHYAANKSDYIIRARVRQQHIDERATPVWADKQKIRAIYKNCPEGFHVDHIVPLKGETVSGLHVPENLQYLPAKENLSKHNFFEGETNGTTAEV